MKKAVRKGSHPQGSKLSTSLSASLLRSQSTTTVLRKGATPLRQKDSKKTTTLTDKVKGVNRTIQIKTGSKEVPVKTPDHDTKHRLSLASDPSFLSEKFPLKAVPPSFKLPLRLRSRPALHSSKELLQYIRSHSSTSDLTRPERSVEGTQTPMRKRPSLSRSESRAKSRLATSMIVEERLGPKIITKVAFRTQTGSVAGRPKKNNQDSLLVCQNYGGVLNQWLFGVFDGHGVNGHHVSAYAKRSLPPHLLSYLPSTPSLLTDSETSILCNGFISSFLTLNHELKHCHTIDSVMSGSTAVAVLVREEVVVCANVGDSRAIVGRKRHNEMWVAVPLSKDHKPDDPIERSRIEQAGGRVEPFQDPDGVFIGPVRVWSQYEQVPGLAMSRSLGDFVAEDIGVIAEPEITHIDLGKEDKFIVLASDGIWEFISSQACVEMVAPFWTTSNAEGACEKLLREALVCWKRDDDVVDDITVIVAFLSG